MMGEVTSSSKGSINARVKISNIRGDVGDGGELLPYRHHYLNSFHQNRVCSGAWLRVENAPQKNSSFFYN